MKKVLALILALVMVLSLAACGGSGTTATNPPSNDTPAASNNEAAAPGSSDSSETPSSGYQAENLNVAISADGGTFDPFASFVNWGKATMMTNIFQGLISIDYDYNVYNCIAKEITQVDDLHWQIEIWDSVYDTVGNQITIDDVIWGYQQAIDTGNAGAIPKFVKLEKTGDFVGVMELSEPFGAGDYEKHMGNIKVLSKKTYEEVCNGDMTNNPIGTGPYVLDSYTVGSEVVLRVNENYWGNNVPEHNDPFSVQNFETITYKIIQDASSRAIALEMGTVDVCDAMDSIDIDNLDTSKFDTVFLPQRPPLAFIMNANEVSVLSDLKLRQAILYGLDNDAIAEGIAVPASPAYGIQPNQADAPASWSTGEGRDYYSYDPDKAAELLAESSYNGEPIVLMYGSSTANDGAVIMIQSQLKKLGINIELLLVDQTVANENKYNETKWDMRMEIMGGGAYLSQVIKSWWSPDIAQHVPDNWNSSMVPDAKLDELYVAVKDDANDETISAWDEYFNSMAYGYAICTFGEQTGINNAFQSTILSSTGTIAPNTFVAAG